MEVEATWCIYQQMIAAYRAPDPADHTTLMEQLIAKANNGVPGALVEVKTLGRTLKTRAADVLAHFDRPRTSNGPTEAINGRLEHLRGKRRFPWLVVELGRGCSPKTQSPASSPAPPGRAGGRQRRGRAHPPGPETVAAISALFS